MWRKLKVFLLNLLFILPLLVASIFYYLKLKRKNSPYTIIMTATVTAFALLFLQVVLVFLYQILPMEWFIQIFTMLLQLPLMRYVIYYGAVILVLIFFGGVVYFIQKKVFSPEKVAIRRIKDKKCPNCSFTLDANHNFCPNCGLQLKEECPNCKNLKIRYLAHCPNCGKK